MSSLRRVSVLTVLMLSLGSAVAFANPNSLLPQAIAQNTEEQSRPNRGRGKAQLFQELNLTPEQTQQIEAIRNQYQDQISQRKQAVRQARQELVELMASTASQNQIREKYRQFAERKQNRWGNYRNRERREQGEQG